MSECVGRILPETAMEIRVQLLLPSRFYRTRKQRQTSLACLSDEMHELGNWHADI